MSLLLRGQWSSRLDLEVDCDVVADHGTRFDGFVPRQAEILTVDDCLRGECNFLVAESIGGGACVLTIERYLFCDAFDGEVARELEGLGSAAYSRAFKGHVWVLFGVEEIRAFEMAIAIRISRTDAVNLDRRFHSGRVELVCDDNLTLGGAEASIDA